MAKKMKDYQIFKCPHCSCEFYDKTARDGKRVGNPMVECPQCKKEVYIPKIMEPALIGGNRYFDIKYSSFYGNIRIGLILLYSVFLFVILVTKSLPISLCLLVAALALFGFYCLLRANHRKTFLQSPEYSKEVEKSLERMADVSYAAMIVDVQGMDDDSVYFFELQQCK